MIPLCNVKKFWIFFYPLLPLGIFGLRVEITSEIDPQASKIYLNPFFKLISSKEFIWNFLLFFISVFCHGQIGIEFNLPVGVKKYWKYRVPHFKNSKKFNVTKSKAQTPQIHKVQWHFIKILAYSTVYTLPNKLHFNSCPEFFALIFNSGTGDFSFFQFKTFDRYSGNFWFRFISNDSYSTRLLKWFFCHLSIEFFKSIHPRRTSFRYLHRFVFVYFRIFLFVYIVRAFAVLHPQKDGIVRKRKR